MKTGNKDETLLSPTESVAIEMNAAPNGNTLSPQPSAAVAPARSSKYNTQFSLPLIAALVLCSLLGIAGFVMAAWSTAQLKQANDYTDSRTSAILTTSMAEVPSTYTPVVNIFRGAGYWTSKRQMEFRRSDHGVAPHNNDAYLIGGLSWNGSASVVLSSLVQYSSIYATSANKTNMPKPRARFGWGVVGSRIFVFGGVDEPLGTPLGDMMIYDMIAETWTNSTSKLNVPRSDSCSDVINGQIYTAGGYDTSFNTLGSIEVYNPATDQWTLLPTSLKFPRGDCGAVAINSQLYVLGGTQQVAGCDTSSATWYLCYYFTPTMERFTPANSSLEQLPSMHNARADFGVVQSSPGRILVAGGEYNDTSLGVFRLLASALVEEYDVATSYWTPLAPLPEPQMRFSMVPGANQLLAFGGQPSCPVVDQTFDDCSSQTLVGVLAFANLVNPNVYLSIRNTTSS